MCLFVMSLSLLPSSALEVSFATKGDKRLLVDIQTSLFYVCMHLPIGRSKLEEVHATAAAIERGKNCNNCCKGVGKTCASPS